ncbi:MAG: DUF362 domain-containing protein [Oscillospiraceae bacterium]|nr:DUF362 domain-containing protein [Oscillospiraceae bacterium]
MSASNVYFTDFRSHDRISQLDKLRKLLVASGFDSIDFEGKFVAIKLHFGELGNLAFLRPNYAKVVADMVKKRGGKPFLTDCNTLYVGSRKDALEHINTAYENGYSPFSTGCQILIGDGLKGSDDVEVPVVGGEYVKNAKIGRAVMDADIFISLSHFKGHEQTGFGGALKNIGMGCGSRAGKMEMHYAGKPVVREKKCVGCGACLKICAHDAPIIADGKCVIDHDKCVGCGRCIAVCPKDAIVPQTNESGKILNCKIAEYAKAVVDGRPHFHISIVRDISPNCDCHAENDTPIVPDVGMFASFDPVALDCACADAVNRQPVLPGSTITDQHHEHMDDRFCAAHSNTNWRDAVEHGEKIGLGVQAYELKEIHA